MLDLFIDGLLAISTPETLLLMVLGVIVGIIFGSVPGLTAVTGIALFLPVTYGLGPIKGMALLMAIYIGAVSGGLIAAILINIPGTPASVATCFDGTPMAKKGEAYKALGAGTVFSFLGTVFGILVLVFISPIIQLRTEIRPCRVFLRLHFRPDPYCKPCGQVAGQGIDLCGHGICVHHRGRGPHRLRGPLYVRLFRNALRIRYPDGAGWPVCHF